MSQIYKSVASSPSVATTYDENTGTATPAANVLNVLGSGNITTSGSGNTITITDTPAQIATNYTNVTTTPYVVTATDYYLSVDTSTLAITIELPNAPTTYRLFVVKDRIGNAMANNVSITTVGGAVTIDGETTYTLNQPFEAVDILFNGTSYEIF